MINALNRALDNREMRYTELNQASSRSHLLIMFNFETSVEVYKRDEKGNFMVDEKGKWIYEFVERSGKLTFIDLAGSERMANLGIDVLLYEEALFINESLQFLGRVIYWLAKGIPHRRLPFNENLLTALLRDTLGGGAETLMIVNISPSAYDRESTMDSLMFAKQTGRIKNHTGEIDDFLVNKEVVEEGLKWLVKY